MFLYTIEIFIVSSTYGYYIFLGLFSMIHIFCFSNTLATQDTDDTETEAENEDIA